MDFTRRALAVGVLASGLGSWMGTARAKSKQNHEGENTVGSDRFQMRAVGRVERRDGVVLLKIFEAYESALVGLEDFSHAHVFWWFDKNDTPAKRGILQVHPRGEKGNPLTGVFATRSPVRPNLIAMDLCAIRSIRGGVIEVDKVDAFDGTPILDIKPYIPGSDVAVGAVRVPKWL